MDVLDIAVNGEGDFSDHFVRSVELHRTASSLNVMRRHAELKKGQEQQVEKHGDSRFDVLGSWKRWPFNTAVDGHVINIKN